MFYTVKAGNPVWKLARLRDVALIIGLIALAAGCVLGWASRYFVIEPDQVGALCAGMLPPAWCAARSLLISVTFHGAYGFTAAGAAVTTWVLRGRTAAAFAVVALFVGGLGLYLYDTSWSASAVLVALLRLPRVGEEPPDPREFTA